MTLRIGFALEQALGHVAYGMSIKRALADRTDIECEWLEIPYELGRFRWLSKVGNNWTIRGSARARTAIAKAHKRKPFDALFVHTQTISLFLRSYMRRIPTLLSLDATPINYDELAGLYGDAVHAAPIERAKLEAHRAVMRNAKSFTVWSEWAKGSLVRDYRVPADHITVLHPGTTLSNFPDPDSRGPRKPGPLRLLFVGGDFKRKGGDLLLDVFKNRLRESCELHLVTGADVPTGNGVYVYKGVKPHSPQLLQLYADADVFVLPTRADCLAVVLGEAMASSLPIITTRVGAHAEAVDDSQSGYVLDVDDAAGLADRIERLAKDPALAARMGRRSREIGEARFDMDKNANRIADLLIEIARRPPAP